MLKRVRLVSWITSKLLVLILVHPLTSTLTAQNDDVGNWLMYFGQNRISDRWSIHSEVQYRHHTLVPNNTEQLLLRVGLNRHIEGGLITFGYGHIGSYVFESERSSPEVEEHRIWQQFISTNQFGRLKLEHRYRLEQRWSNKEYKNRVRYRLMLFYPLNKPKIEKGAVFLGVYDEVFLNTKQTYFDRNRLYGAIGYQINDKTGLQLGGLHQETNAIGKWYFQLALTFNTDFRKND